jgi:hypothetical protein
MLPDDFPYQDYLPNTPFARPVPGVLVDADEGTLVSISFNPAWLPYVLGALKPLTLASTWKIEGDNTLELQQKRAMGLIHQFMQAKNGDRPFFQDAEEASDDSLPDYPWYEQASDWVIELFLAYTATPGAAIAYKVFIPRLRLAFRTGNLGTIFKVLLDGLEVTTGDSYAPLQGLIEKQIDVQGFAAEHNLGAGPYTMKIVNVGRATAGLRSVMVPHGGNLLEVIRGDIRPIDTGNNETGGAIDLGDNEMKLRVNPNNPCQLQKMCDCDTEWTLFFDPTTCANFDVQKQVKDVVTQPAAAGGIPAGECREYDVVVNGNQEWLFPSPVGAGYTIELTAITGGWNDGAGAGGWFCPDGSAYILGDCIGGKGHATGDPATALFHGQLFADVGGTFYDPFAGPFTIPGGVSNASFTLRMNDVSLADNYGSVSLHVKVCAGQSTGWTHSFDFLTSNGGFLDYTDSAGHGRATWDSDLGWGSGYYPSTVQIQFIVQNKSGKVTHLEFRLSEPMVNGQYFDFGNGAYDPNQIHLQSALATFGFDCDKDFTDQNVVWLGVDDSTGTAPRIVGLTFSGTGQDIYT